MLLPQFRFFKIKIERKPQKNFPTNFIKLLLENKGISTEKRKILELLGGGRGLRGEGVVLALFGGFYKLGTKQACAKRRAF